MAEGSVGQGKGGQVSLGDDGTLNLHPSLGLNGSVGYAVGEVLSTNLGTDGTYPNYFLPILEPQRQTQAIAVCGLGHPC
jgi:hypothetical protein